MTDIPRQALTMAGVAGLLIGLSACKAEVKPLDSDDGSSTVTHTTSVMVTTVTESASTTSSAARSATAAGSVAGPGCAGYEQQVPTGPGSVDGMKKDLLGVAVSNNPQLTRLTDALSGKLNPQVNLLDTVNKGEYTLFAPTDAAFAKLDAATSDRLKTDSAYLNGVLTYHLVNGQLTPALADGIHQTLDASATVTVTGTTDDLKVNGAGVICGGMSAANAQIYLIDTVLLPPAGR